MSAAPLTAVLACSDLARSVRFYTDVLGFDVAEGWPLTTVRLDRGGAVLALEQADAAAVTAALDYPGGRGVALRVATVDAEALYASVQAYGARIHRPLADRRGQDGPAGGVWREFAVMDPDGYLLCFAQDLGGGAPTGEPAPGHGGRARPPGLLGRLRLATRDGVGEPAGMPGGDEG